MQTQKAVQDVVCDASIRTPGRKPLAEGQPEAAVQGKEQKRQRNDDQGCSEALILRSPQSQRYASDMPCSPLDAAPHAADCDAGVARTGGGASFP